ncbi:MAG: LUD domain-containing protein, partial [Firmicutes bacterium]|nr:LUD domain-containing protein [Bacillota bacterium]
QVRKLEADAEVYMCSVNGASEKGEMVNIDGSGNRVASNLWGHKKYYFVFGVNKIVPTLTDALERARTVAGPLNAARLNLDTPCVKLGHCIDCRSPKRICNGASILYRPTGGSDMEVVLIGEKLGY